MKKQLITFFLFLSVNIIVKSQDLHTPAEVLGILEKSSISYELFPLKEKIIAKDRSSLLNYNTSYRVEKGDELLTYKYTESDSVKSLLLKAEAYFKDEKFDLAREYYLKILEEDSTYYKVMTYIGQTFVIEGDVESGEKWYNKAIASNYIDYMPHWFLADLYRDKKELDKALSEITIARVLNVNNPRIKKSFDKIYDLNKIKNPDWTFTPQIRIEKKENNKVMVQFHGDWLGYALVKALWQHEPGYKKSMGVEEGMITTTEEKEAFVSLMTTFDKKKLKNNPEFKVLEKSVKEEMVDEFIFYEIILPDYPNVALQLPKEFIQNICTYVIKCRGGK